MSYRIETDTLGEVKVPKDKYWGAQTQRSKENFPIGQEKMPQEIIAAFALLKKSTAKANAQLGLLEKKKSAAIAYAADEVLAGGLDAHFPSVVWRTGSGTQSNINTTALLAFVVYKWLKEQGSDLRLRTNDDADKSISSNDTYPTAMHIAFVLKVKDAILPALRQMKQSVKEKIDAFQDIVKIGRTHLQDATPLTLGQEISGWYRMLEKSETMLVESVEQLKELAIGGTAVGTGLNAHPDYAEDRKSV